jgi:hypothetical protein
VKLLDAKLFSRTLKKFEVAVEEGSRVVSTIGTEVRDPFVLRDSLLGLWLIESKEVLDFEDTFVAQLKLLHKVLECSTQEHILHDEAKLARFQVLLSNSFRLKKHLLDYLRKFLSRGCGGEVDLCVFRNLELGWEGSVEGALDLLCHLIVFCLHFN